MTLLLVPDLVYLLLGHLNLFGDRIHRYFHLLPLLALFQFAFNLNFFGDFFSPLSSLSVVVLNPIVGITQALVFIYSPRLRNSDQT